MGKNNSLHIRIIFACAFSFLKNPKIDLVCRAAPSWGSRLTSPNTDLKMSGDSAEEYSPNSEEPHVGCICNVRGESHTGSLDAAQSRAAPGAFCFLIRYTLSEDAALLSY